MGFAVLCLALAMMGVGALVLICTFFALFTVDLEVLKTKLKDGRGRFERQMLIWDEHPNLARALVCIVFCAKWSIPTLALAGILRFMGL